MAISLVPLPFGITELAPAISAETLSFHHGKHHRSYVDKLNAAIERTDMARDPLETIIAKTRGSNQGVFNNAAQTWNHGFYWMSLTSKSTAPDASLAAGIDKAFGSLQGLKERLAAAGASHFASGWVWLVARGDELTVEQTHDGDTLADSHCRPLLVMDLWEHAYYIDHRNDRAAYLAAAIARLDWSFAAGNLVRNSAWTYPA